MKNLTKLATVAMVGLIFLLAACTAPPPPERTSSVDAGTVTGVEFVPETFVATWAKTNITTTKGVFVVRGTRSVFKNDLVTIDTYDNGKKYICFESSDGCLKIWGNADYFD